MIVCNLLILIVASEWYLRLLESPESAVDGGWSRRLLPGGISGISSILTSSFRFPVSSFRFPSPHLLPPPSSIHPSLLPLLVPPGFFFCFSHLFPINRLSTDHPTLQLILIELWLNWRLLPIYQPEWVLDLRPTIAWSKLVKSASGHTI